LHRHIAASWLAVEFESIVQPRHRHVPLQPETVKSARSVRRKEQQARHGVFMACSSYSRPVPEMRYIVPRQHPRPFIYPMESDEPTPQEPQPHVRTAHSHIDASRASRTRRKSARAAGSRRAAAARERAPEYTNEASAQEELAPAPPEFQRTLMHTLVGLLVVATFLAALLFVLWI